MITKRILVVGFGQAGKSLAASLKRNGQQIEGFLDDTHMGIRVLGALADVNKVVKKYGITDIYFAIPSISAGGGRGCFKTTENKKRKKRTIHTPSCVFP